MSRFSFTFQYVRLPKAFSQFCHVELSLRFRVYSFCFLVFSVRSRTYQSLLFSKPRFAILLLSFVRLAYTAKQSAYSYFSLLFFRISGESIRGRENVFYSVPNYVVIPHTLQYIFFRLNDSTFDSEAAAHTAPVHRTALPLAGRYMSNLFSKNFSLAGNLLYNSRTLHARSNCI